MSGFEIAVMCLALNIYKEARGEPYEGQLAVAHVTLNRVKASGRTKDVCDVVFEPSQFSWTLTDVQGRVLKPGKAPDRKSAEWASAYRVAHAALLAPDFTGGATHYHEASISPAWRRDMEFKARYGNHLFYREPPKVLKQDQPPQLSKIR